MDRFKQKVDETADFLKSRIVSPPTVGLLTGTGLGESVESMSITTELDYRDVPHFPISTVQSHLGRMLFGDMNGCSAVVLQGRFHLYEGYSPCEVTYPIRVMQALGVKTLILSNAAGGLNPGFEPGDIMMIADHINLTGANPLIGPNEESWGIRFPDMSRAYDPKLITMAQSVATTAGINLQKGVYAGLKGPSLETPAEIRFLKTIGAEAVGFSTVQETIAAVHAGMRVLGFSIITNVHDPDNPAPATLEEIIAVAKTATSVLDEIINSVAERLNGQLHS
jgi:purine-nucleoside phosphorylase